MKCNVSKLDRILRFFIGFLLSFWVFVGGPTWAYFGIYLMATGSWGFCLIYAFFKINTIKELRNTNVFMDSNR